MGQCNPPFVSEDNIELRFNNVKQCLFLGYVLYLLYNKFFMTVNLLCQLCLTSAVRTNCTDIIFIDTTKIQNRKTNKWIHLKFTEQANFQFLLKIYTIVLTSFSLRGTKETYFRRSKIFN